MQKILVATDGSHGGNRAVWPGGLRSRDQWCEEAQAYMPTKHGGGFWKKTTT